MYRANQKLISYLPDNNLSDVPIVPTQDDINRITDNLVDIIPQDSNKPYDMMEIITSVVDNGDFFEIQKDFAKNIIIGFGRMNGGTVGIVAISQKLPQGFWM